jgi:3-isopropylmalate/(R)-2-methylmalate dehydratase small subunit
MQPFRIETGLVVPLLRDDVDTDQIIPKQFLKRIGRSGFGECLFHDWRADPAFVLNDERYRGATILLAGRNFGCGSSREHAAWALRDFGFRAILAPSFADIFVANCTNNGIAAIVVDVVDVGGIARRADQQAGYELTVDLENLEIRDALGLIAPFEIDPFRRERLLHGYDEIALTLRHESKIAEFEAHQRRMPRTARNVRVTVV